jgi:peptide/nickel transport system permease protein
MAKTNTLEQKETPARQTVRLLFENKFFVIGGFFVLVLIFVAVFSPLLSPYTFEQQSLSEAFQWPGKAHPFGTDEFGRDILCRIMFGARYSLVIGLLSIMLSALMGIPLGIAAAYNTKVDNLIMRTLDVLMSIPQILLAIAILAALGPGISKLIIAVSISAMPGFARITRSCVLTAKNEPYIESARISGAGPIYIIFRHIIPAIVAPLSVHATLRVAFAILTTSGLSFLGLGISPPTPEWGSMLASSRDYIRDYWYMTMFPGFAIMFTILGLNFVGDGMRDVFDPKNRGR